MEDTAASMKISQLQLENSRPLVNSIKSQVGNLSYYAFAGNFWFFPRQLLKLSGIISNKWADKWEDMSSPEQKAWKDIDSLSSENFFWNWTCRNP